MGFEDNWIPLYKIVHFYMERFLFDPLLCKKEST